MLPRLIGFFLAVIQDLHVRLGLDVANMRFLGLLDSIADPPAVETEPFAETPIDRMVALAIAKMPLSETAGHIARALQKLRKQVHILFDSVPGRIRVLFAIERILATHQAHPAGNADRIGMERSELNALLCDPVNIRGLDL